jgi:hypothetical protein
MADYGSNEFST